MRTRRAAGANALATQATYRLVVYAAASTRIGIMAWRGAVKSENQAAWRGVGIGERHQHRVAKWRNIRQRSMYVAAKAARIMEKAA